MFVRGVRGTYGALLDNCSTDTYIVNSVARRQKLRCVQKLHLEVEGMYGEVFRVESKVYEVPVREDNNKIHVLECYGVNVISRPVGLPDTNSYAAFCKQFNVPPDKVKRPRGIDLLISMRESHLLPKRVRTVGKLTLYHSPFVATFGGSDHKLMFGSFPKNFKSPAQIHPAVSATTMKT